MSHVRLQVHGLNAIRAAADLPEATVLAELSRAIPSAASELATATGRGLVAGARARADERPYLDAFLQEFGLSNPEGVALMCLAEALLRVPDATTANDLIAEKLSSGDWGAHAGRSESLFVNASTWGLMLTGRMVCPPAEAENDVARWLGSLARRAGEPVIRKAVQRAMRIIGEEFVVGTTIDSSLARSGREPSLALCSFDMLGEGARTDADADRYLEAYTHAIDAIAASVGVSKTGSADPYAVSSLSIKLSALDPRYSLMQAGRVRSHMIPRALELVRMAAERGLAVTIDAEEADRLEISLEVVAALAGDKRTRDWPGLGFAVQAYGKRAPAVIDWAYQLAVDTGRRIGIRLVKGAYWDSEIKRAQERGLSSYPVYTRKVSTDVAYLGCTARLFSVASRIYSAFATHNAHTIGAVLAIRPRSAACEFQRLHGMGVLLYDEAQRQIEDFPPVRVYAPVGSHANLLAYLVRRLLENGANTSFVNRFMDERIPVTDVVRDPTAELEGLALVAHPDIPEPMCLYGSTRTNSRGIDFGRDDTLDDLAAVVSARNEGDGDSHRGARCLSEWPIVNPADRSDIVGWVEPASIGDVKRAFESAASAWSHWNNAGAECRVQCLERAAEILERQRDLFLRLLVRESGKILPDAVAEFREAVDYCRYYAADARRQFAAPRSLAGPTGESNELSFQGRGVVACISPWNFPLAIFAGQVVGALAAGNAVIAKPAEATPLIALEMTRLLYEAGVPGEVLHCLPMTGVDFGAVALADPCLAGVVFTGSSATAHWLNRRLAQRDGPILPLIAETGGLNAMVVDSTALPEQVVDDVVTSAFGSAGQRCSALRVLFLQDDVADAITDMLVGAMDTLVIGNPAQLSTDIGPVISATAASTLHRYVESMQSQARIIRRLSVDEQSQHGHFVGPTLIEVSGLDALRQEQFGPILHLVRYPARNLGEVLNSIRRSGFALTLGIHTRIDAVWRSIYAGTTIGNTYVNRNMVGAMVGVQPFGGGGLSGTGPKAGGPHYLTRLATERTLTINTSATGGNRALLQLI